MPVAPGGVGTPDRRDHWAEPPGTLNPGCGLYDGLPAEADAHRTFATTRPVRVRTTDHHNGTGAGADQVHPSCDADRPCGAVGLGPCPSCLCSNYVLACLLSTTSAVVTSLAAAAAFALATVLQSVSAHAVPPVAGMRPGQIVTFLRATLSHRLYLLGLSVDVVGLALHVVALHLGALAVVQPLMVTGVLFTLPLYARVTGRPISAVELGWAAVLTVGLAGFLVIAATPGAAIGAPGTQGDQVGQVDNEPAWVAAIVAVLVALACTALARRSTAKNGTVSAKRSSSTTSAALLGVAAGIAFAGTAALIKSSADVLVSDPRGLLTALPFYGLLVVGVCGLVLHQLALAAGPLTASLPAFTVIDPLVSVALGVTVYNERLRATPGALVLQALTLGLLVVGAIALTRAEASSLVVAAPLAGPPGRGE